MKKEKISRIIYKISIFVSGILFFFLLGNKGYCIEADSGTFINPSTFISSRYVIYPFFLKVCKMVFGDSSYLTMVFIFQGLFAFGVSILLTKYLRKFYVLHYNTAFLFFLCSFGPYAYSLPQVVSTHHILTEGLAFPFFNLYMICIMKVFLERKNVWLIPLLMNTIILALIRTQLMLFVIVYIFICIYKLFQLLYKHIFINKTLQFIFLVLITCILCIILSVYSLLFCLKTNRIPQVTDAMAGRAFTLIDKSDLECEDESEHELLGIMYEKIDNSRHRLVYFPKGIYQWEDMVIAINENTKDAEILIQTYGEMSKQQNFETGIIKGKLTSQLLLNHVGEYIYMTAVLTLQSLVVAIFVHPAISLATYILGYIIAILFYIVTITALVKAKKKYQVENQYLTPMVITLFLIMMITVITNILFMGLQRYVVYPFGWFYISVFLIVVGFRRRLHEQDK